jgi:aldehyde:ferredoxin oxidoreductase
MLGKILDIDLASEAFKLSEYPQDLARKYLGGRGFNLHILNDQLPVDANPLGPENILLISCGLLTGTAAPSSARLHINALSPLTAILGSSNLGGHFGPRLRSNGIQSIIVRGKSTRPVYLWIDADTIEIRSAQSLWGLDTWKTEDRLKQQAGAEKIQCSDHRTGS